MPTLENERWELFANFLARGKARAKSYAEAGFKPNAKNAVGGFKACGYRVYAAGRGANR